jgi:hypothetical protein
MSGWIPVWRKLFDPDHPLAPDKRTPASKIHAWIDLCQMAQHDEYEHAGERLGRGEVLGAVRTFARRWGWSKSRVERFINDLATRTQLETVRGTPRGTIYRIVNYETYACPTNYDRDIFRDKKRDTSGTRAGQEQQLTIKKTEYTSDFEQVWRAHPRGPKKDASDQYRKAVPARISHEKLMVYLQAYRRGFDDGFSGVHLFRWIRDSRWEELEVSANGNGKRTDVSWLDGLK